ncbi:MAG TPA: NAD-dependent succinate-semialdehyde dehydrogenase [Noviherbaspirillum sp.]|nr:NAD-dependent succinate-semialdehyde dehydrogenase [Noviherbaspirillum sp.]
MHSVNPYTGETIRAYDAHSDEQVDQQIRAADRAFHEWRKTSFAERARLMHSAAAVLRDRKRELADLMADEMGKVLRDGVAEIEKCAACCDYFANNAAGFLASQHVDSDAADSYVAFDPLGVILAVMPWNFPFWQVFRFAAPSLMAGNTGVLKHASNVCGCALAIQDIFEQAGFPQHVFGTLLVDSARVEHIIRHPLVRAVTLTGSTPAGRSVAGIAGAELKKTVLELGGSDPYLVLDDADLELAVATCVQSRLINAGQSCIAAKRFIVVAPLYADFVQRYVEKFNAIRCGDPKDDATDIGPLARPDLRDGVHEQVQQTVRQGARLLTGGQIPPGPGCCYPPTVLADVKPGMSAFDEEIFGPVAAIVEAADEAEAITLANRSEYGLGAAVFTRDQARADRIARAIEAGSVFVNAFVKSDARLPFGGVKHSGYGRELSSFGIREFVNIKTVWHAATRQARQQAAAPGKGRAPE